MGLELCGRPCERLAGRSATLSRFLSLCAAEAAKVLDMSQ